MRLLKMLNTDDLKYKILNEFEKRETVCPEFMIILEKNITNGQDGTYIYADDQGYHYVQMERGNKEVHKVTDDVFDKQLEYLDHLGENFRKRGEIEISEILKVNPY